MPISGNHQLDWLSLPKIPHKPTNQPILPLVTLTSGFAKKKKEIFAGSPESM
jgi:hypothetical protein